MNIPQNHYVIILIIYHIVILIFTGGIGISQWSSFQEKPSLEKCKRKNILPSNESKRVKCFFHYPFGCVLLLSGLSQRSIIIIPCKLIVSLLDKIRIDLIVLIVYYHTEDLVLPTSL